MFNTLAGSLRKATTLTANSRLADATAAIQQALKSQAPSHPSPLYRQAAPASRPAAALGDIITHHIRGLRARMPHTGTQTGTQTGTASPQPATPEGAQFLARTFANDAESRPYKLYVPSGYRAGTPVPLIVMLHGCTQSPDDFATGTRMNELAEASGFLVAYPGQTRSANMQKCWNWFNPADQARNAGEPALIAGITRQVMAEYAIDPARVFAAGLSAGGAAAAIMGQAYPDLYAGIGIHSGLACGAARDIPSAFTAMRQGAGGQGTGPFLPTIVFHGACDTTVNPRNGEAIVAQLAGSGTAKKSVQAGQVPCGRSYTRIVHRDARDRIVVEHWVVAGAAHAWFGGSANGSYTDPLGPDASAEMIRFFKQIKQMG
jgi:poly(hydroxyalkanoate) depolymerase family esterase